MNSSPGSPHPSVAESSPNARPGVPLFRLYTLRLGGWPGFHDANPPQNRVRRGPASGDPGKLEASG